MLVNPPHCLSFQVRCEAIPDRGYDFGHWSVTNNTNQNPVVLMLLVMKL